MAPPPTSLRRNGEDSSVPILDEERILVNQTRTKEPLSVLFVKIDDFSKLCTVSDRITGIELYEHLAEHFGEFIPEASDTYQLPRSGLVYLVDGKSRENVEDVVGGLVAATESPVEVGNRGLNLSVSIGIARGTTTTDGNLLDRAQFARYHASQETGSAYAFFDEQEAESTRDEVSLKNDLYTALERDEFVLEFQPIVSLEDFTIEGAEALVRWHHPERGVVSPGQFIPLAERTGQILFLDRWVIEEALRQAARWHEELERDLTIGINLSAWQFRDNYLVEKVDELLDETGLPPSTVKFEVTETSMMQDVDRTGRVLQDLEDLGVQVALDDFGTGHATFEYLSQFPIDELKIDRSFLDFDDVYSKNQQLVEIMIQTGQRIGTDILTEGIETPEQLHFLRNRGCEKAQGFLFSKPLPTDDFHSLVEDNEPLYQEDTQPHQGTLSG